MYKFDCEQDGCGECVVCKYLDFLDRAQAVAPMNSTIERNPLIEKYLKIKDEKIKFWFEMAERISKHRSDDPMEDMVERAGEIRKEVLSIFCK